MKQKEKIRGMILSFLLAGVSILAMAASPNSDKPDQAPEPFTLAKDGISKAVIVVDRNAPDTTKKAARMLAEYFYKLSKASFMVAEAPVPGYKTILVGTPYKGTKSGELSIRVKGADTLEVTGADAYGIQYAVQDLLEYFGVVFCTPRYDYVPEVNDLSLPCGYNKTDAPFMNVRGYCPSGITAESTAFMMKLRLNMKEKLLAEYGGGEELNFCSNRYYKLFPEHWAFDKNGKRTIRYWFCPSDEELYPKLFKEIEIDIQKGQKMISLGVDDGGYKCQCEKCRKLTLVKTKDYPEGREYSSIQNMTLLNRVAEHFRDKYPDVTFSMLAYIDFSLAPPADLYKFEPNAGCGIALLWRNFGRPVSACERSIKEHDNWGKLLDPKGKGGLYIWDYYANYANFIQPFPNLDTMGMNLRHYKKVGVKMISPQMQFSSIGDLNELHFWLFSQLCWNPDADDKALVTKYLNAAYGKAAPFIQEYLDLITRARNRQFNVWIGCYNPNTDHWLSGKDCVKVLDLWNKAQAAVLKDPVRRRLVSQSRLSALTMALNRYNDMIEPAAELRFRLPTREKLYEEWLNIITVAVADGFYTEFAEGNQLGTSFQNFFKKSLEKPAQATKFQPVNNSIHFPAKDMTGGTRMEKQKDPDGAEFARIKVSLNGEPEGIWMNPAFAEAGITLTGEQEGEWYVFATVRTGATVPYDRAAAYFGIYRPNRVSTSVTEIATMPIPGEKGKEEWKTVCLGKYILVDKTRLWLTNGVLEPTKFADVKSFTLVNPAVIEKSFPAGKVPVESLCSIVQPASTLKAKGLNIQKDKYDNFSFARIQNADQGMPEYTVGKGQDGEWFVFAEVRIDTDKEFDPAAATIDLLSPKAKDGNQDKLASASIKAEYGNPSWQIVCLGKQNLKEGSVIRFAPAINKELKAADIKNIMFVKPEIMESSVKK